MFGRYLSLSTLATIIITVIAGCSPTALPEISAPSSTSNEPRRSATPSPEMSAPSSTSDGSRQIVDNTMGLHEYWRISQACLSGTSNLAQVGLAAVSDRVACLHFDTAIKRLSIQVLNTNDGTLLWEATGVSSSGFGSVYVDRQQLYFESLFEIRAYDLENGQQLWDKSVSLKGDPLYLNEDKLYALQRGRGGPWMLFTFDAATGETLSQKSVSTNDDFFLLYQFPDFDLYFGLQPQSGLRAIDRADQRLRWQSTDKYIYSLPSWPPELFNGMLLIDTGEEVVAFDAQSGQIRWRSLDRAHASGPIFVTRAVLMNGALYALCSDGRLIRLDPKTGQETGHLQLTSGLPTPESAGVFFSLATDGRMLFVSFSDTKETIALGP